jgi:hypothetical protein
MISQANLQIEKSAYPPSPTSAIPDVKVDGDSQKSRNTNFDESEDAEKLEPATPFNGAVEPASENAAPPPSPRNIHGVKWFLAGMTHLVAHFIMVY